MPEEVAPGVWTADRDEEERIEVFSIASGNDTKSGGSDGV